jgi:hypothetical protein
MSLCCSGLGMVAEDDDRVGGDFDMDFIILDGEP